MKKYLLFSFMCGLVPFVVNAEQCLGTIVSNANKHTGENYLHVKNGNDWLEFKCTGYTSNVDSDCLSGRIIAFIDDRDNLKRYICQDNNKWEQPEYLREDIPRCNRGDLFYEGGVSDDLIGSYQSGMWLKKAGKDNIFCFNYYDDMMYDNICVTANYIQFHLCSASDKDKQQWELAKICDYRKNETIVKKQDNGEIFLADCAENSRVDSEKVGFCSSEDLNSYENIGLWNKNLDTFLFVKGKKISSLGDRFNFHDSSRYYSVQNYCQGCNKGAEFSNGKCVGTMDSKEIEDAKRVLSDFFALTERNKNVWRDADGNFNTARLASDVTAGVVLGTVGGVVSGVVIKKKQVEKGFDALHCTVGGQTVADWGDTFRVGITK